MKGYKSIGSNNLSQKESLGNINVKTINGSQGSYLAGITSNIQNQINSLVSTGNVYYIPNNYDNDIITLSGAIYYIQNTYPKYNDIITLSGGLFNLNNALFNLNNVVTVFNYNIFNRVSTCESLIDGLQNMDYPTFDYIVNNYIGKSGLTFTTNKPQITLAYGSLPTVAITKQIVDNNVNYDLVFSIPKGDKGDKGDGGGGGPEGPRGPKGDKGNRGNSGVNVGSLIGFILAAIGIGGLIYGEVSLQAQIVALGFKTSALICDGLNATIATPLAISLLPAVRLLIETTVISINSIATTTMTSQSDTNINTEKIMNLTSNDTININAADTVNISAKNINFYGNVTKSSDTPQIPTNTREQFSQGSDSSLNQIDNYFSSAFESFSGTNPLTRIISDISSEVSNEEFMPLLGTI